MNELVSLLPPAMPLLDAGLLVTASLVTSFISAAFGIGGGFTLIALLALLLPPAALIPVHGIVQLGSNAGRVGIMLKQVVWRPVMPFVIGTVTGAGLGAVVVVQLPPWGCSWRWAFSSFGRYLPNCRPSNSGISCLAALFPAF